MYLRPTQVSGQIFFLPIGFKYGGSGNSSTQRPYLFSAGPTDNYVAFYFFGSTSYMDNRAFVHVRAYVDYINSSWYTL
jgi:hypothetical protein